MTAEPDASALTEEALPSYIAELGLAVSSEHLAVEVAGDGNVNWVRRVRSLRDGRSWIVKQARPALERFPEYRVSTERIVFEHRWLGRARPLDGDRVLPGVVAFDEKRRVLVLEDLGAAERLDAALARGADVAAAVRTLARFLGAVHGDTAGEAYELAPRFANDEMRRLHGEHIFHLPFHPNEFPLPPGLRAAAERVWADTEVVEITTRAHARYLEPRGALVHGDVQAGNVLLAPRGPVLLDAEIAHVGDASFDLGTLLAHLWLGGFARADTASAAAVSVAAWRAWEEGWREFAVRGEEGGASFAATARYAAIEVARRTIGAARVAAVADQDVGIAALGVALRLVRQPPSRPEDLAAALVIRPST